MAFDKDSVMKTVQVCHDLTGDNRRRELVGLQLAMAWFGLKRGTLLPHWSKNELQPGVGCNCILPAWEWRLTVLTGCEIQLIYLGQRLS